MSTQPLFSIVLPTYNRPGLLQDAVDSVLAQSFTNWELIIIDDGSDSSEAQPKNNFPDERIQYHYQKNEGKSAARNRGIDLATATYITFLDDDDLYLEGHLSALASLIIANQYPVVAIRTEAYRQQGDIRKPLEMMPGGSAGIRFVWRKGAAPFFFALHRDILQTFQFDPRFPFAQDMHFLIRVLLHYPVLYTGRYTLVLVEHPHRSSHAADVTALQKNLSSRLAVIKDIETQYKIELSNHLKEADFAFAKSRAYLIAAYQAFRLGDFQQGWVYNQQAYAISKNLITVWKSIRNMWPYFKPNRR